jgi:phytanoyl-CoA hydroxylase
VSWVYWVGSHELDDFLYDGGYKSVAEAQRINGPGSLGQQVGEHVASLGRRAAEAGLRNERFAARRGDVLIWHADLVHGGNPVSNDITRKSVVTHYCPKYLVPLFAETQQARFFLHAGHLFTSSHYAFDPKDCL